MLQSQQETHAAIAAALQRIHPFSAAHRQQFISATSTRFLKKNEVLLSEGSVCNFIAIVTLGSLRVFRTCDEKEATVNFFTEMDFAADHESFVKQQPAANRIEALEDSVVALLTIHQLHQLIHVDPSFFALGRVMENWTKPTGLAPFVNSPQIRYEKLLELHPDWILRFSQIHLASYLGMAPETFSRMKRKSLFS